MPNIADQIDAALGAAPPDVAPLDATLTLGRRALRRRRAAYVVGAAAAALVIGGTAWATAPGDEGPDRTEDPGFSGEVSDSTSPVPTQPVGGDGTAEPWVFGDEAAALMEDGTIVTKPGWEVVDTIEEPSGPNTVAVDVTNGEKHQWFLWSGAGTLHVPEAPDRDYASFGQWVTVNGPTMVADPGSDGDTGGALPGIERDDLVAFSPPQASSPEPGTLLPLHDTQIIEQRPGVDVGASFAAPGDVTGAALVASEGSRTFVLARRVDGDPAQYIAVNATRVMDTLDEFLEFARARYADGGGGLL